MSYKNAMKSVLSRGEPFCSLAAAVFCAVTSFGVEELGAASDFALAPAVLAKALLVLSGFWGSLAIVRYRRRHQVCLDAKELTLALKDFAGWLERRRDSYHKQRVRISAEHAGKGSISSSMFMQDHAWALVEFWRDVDQEWSLRVEHPTARLLALAGLKDLYYFDRFLSEAYLDCCLLRSLRLNECKAEAQKEARKGSRHEEDMEWFHMIVEERCV